MRVLLDISLHESLWLIFILMACLGKKWKFQINESLSILLAMTSHVLKYLTLCTFVYTSTYFLIVWFWTTDELYAGTILIFIINTIFYILFYWKIKKEIKRPENHEKYPEFLKHILWYTKILDITLSRIASWLVDVSTYVMFVSFYH